MRNDVRELRMALNLSQGELAKLLNVSRQTVNSIETGRYNPTLPLAIQIARVFGRAIEEVFHVDDDEEGSSRDRRVERGDVRGA